MKSVQTIVADHSLFRALKAEHIAVLLEGARAASFKEGEMLFREGEPANQFYLIESGKIALEAHEPADGTFPVQTLAAGDVLGWSWLFPPFLWHFQARAVVPTNVVILNGGHLLAAAEKDHDFGYELMKRVVQVVIQRLHATRKATRKQLLNFHVEAALEG